MIGLNLQIVNNSDSRVDSGATTFVVIASVHFLQLAGITALILERHRCRGSLPQMYLTFLMLFLVITLSFKSTVKGMPQTTEAPCCATYENSYFHSSSFLAYGTLASVHQFEIQHSFFSTSQMRTSSGGSASTQQSVILCHRIWTLTVSYKFCNVGTIAFIKVGSHRSPRRGS